MESLGLIAGSGQFPIIVANEAKKQGLRVVAVGISRITSPNLLFSVDKLSWIELGNLSKLIKEFKAEGVNQAIMAGQIRHVNLFRDIKFDWRTLLLLRRLINKKADTILGAVANELEREGIHILESTKYITHLLPAPGVLTKRKPSRKEIKDIEFGFEIAKKIAGSDIGQTVVVKDLTVVAVEAMEGTDETIRRGGQIGGGKTVVVKVSKPNQDMRFDVPVIGLGTINSLKEAKAAVLAIESGKTLFFDQQTAIAEADAEKICLVSVRIGQSGRIEFADK
ncbi:MAG: UDP-2,3-diacylglucosamine diphosphatase LpxI [bacterium]|nr:UDP-2,3-diacylglucosamine diphosphatase LpxI [bacterium]